MTHLRQGFGGQARDQHLASIGCSWRQAKDRHDATVHLTKKGVACCGTKLDFRHSTPFLGGWGKLCKNCVKISGAGR